MPKIIKKSENFLGSYIFKYESFEASVEKDIIHNTYGPATIKFNINPDTDSKISFGYAPQKGLVKFNQLNGSIEENNVLGDLISIKENDSNALSKYFAKYGFLFHVTRYSNIKFDLTQLFDIINHLKWVTELMWQLCDNKNRNYQKIVKLIFKLVFDKEIKIMKSNNQVFYLREKNSLFKKLESYAGGNYIESQLQIYDPDEEYHIEPNDFEMYDNIYGNVKVKFDEFETTVTKEGFRLLNTIFALHYDNNENKSGDKIFWDFLFHFFQLNDGALLLGLKYSDTKEIDETKLILKEEFKESIIRIGRHVLAEEITNHIKSIKPFYDPLRLEPAWHIPNLLTALYLSLFYMKPNVELIRKCQNPNCDNYFIVNTSSTRTKYCCTNCGNAVAQANYRSKHKYGK